jgi:hypothetical protein
MAGKITITKYEPFRMPCAFEVGCFHSLQIRRKKNGKTSSIHLLSNQIHMLDFVLVNTKSQKYYFCYQYEIDGPSFMVV